MDQQRLQQLLSLVRRDKQAIDAPDFATALQHEGARQIKAQALSNIGSIGLAMLGGGAAARGGVGLANMLRRNANPLDTRSGPALLPLPYPAAPEEDEETPPRRRLPKTAGLGDFVGGDMASTVSGIPWYGPAMMTTGLLGAGAGWKGVDTLLNWRRKRERRDEVDQARKEFHDAIISQYDKPVSLKSASDNTLSQDLDQLADRVLTKIAEGGWANTMGQLAGGYGTMAGLSGLLAGAVVYNQAQKRSQRAVIEKAMQRRARRRFAQQPTEIYAIPEPMRTVPHAPLDQELDELVAQE